MEGMGNSFSHYKRKGVDVSQGPPKKRKGDVMWIHDVINTPPVLAENANTEWDYLTENPPAPILWKPLYDGVVDELELSYHGSNSVTYPINPLPPPFPT